MTDTAPPPTVQLHRTFPPPFITSIQKPPWKRTEADLATIYATLRQFDCLRAYDDGYLHQISRQCDYEHKAANDILYCRGEVATVSYILLTGSVFIDMNMFLPVTSFGRHPSHSRRPNECLILEPSDMLCIPSEIDRNSIYSTTSSEESSSAGYSGSDLMDLDGLVESTVDSDDEDLDGDADAEFDDTTSIVLRDAVRDCLERDPLERTPEDIQILLEFTQHLSAFNDLTTTTRRALCSVMVFAVVDRAGTVVLNHGEELDSWSVVVHGSVEIERDGQIQVLLAGDSFGLPPTLDTQWFDGEMRTRVDDCQFICVTQEDYFRILRQGQESQITHTVNNTPVLITELKQVESGGGPPTGTTTTRIIIRGTPLELMSQLIHQENASTDPTYIEDFLLTYRIFTSAELLADKLLEWFREGDDNIKDRVTRVVLLWVNNHFVDFEGSRDLMRFLTGFQLLLEDEGMNGQLRLLQIACSAKSRPRSITITRSDREEPLQFQVMGGSENGYGIYVSQVAEALQQQQGSGSGSTGPPGLRVGDEVLSINGQPCSTLARAIEMLRNSTHLVLNVKCNFLGHHECIHSKAPLIPKQQHGQGHGGHHVHHVIHAAAGVVTSGTKKEHRRRFHDIKNWWRVNLMGRPAAAAVDGHGHGVSQRVTPDQGQGGQGGGVGRIDFPENVLKIYRPDQSYKYFLVNKETTAREVVMLALAEFPDLQQSNSCSADYSLYQVSAMGGILKQGRLPDSLDSLAERIPLGARYYLRPTTTSMPLQLLPDESIPALQQESEVNFLQLNPLELALQLTLEDYTIFRRIDSTEFINDLFELGPSPSPTSNLDKFAQLVNKETFWVVTEVTRESGSVHRRSAIIKRFIKIATQCKECRNYNSMFAIVSGLGHGAVSRLKSSWERLGRKYARAYAEMQLLMDPTRNMGKYRTLLAAPSTSPLIPFYPVIRKDLTFIHLGNSTRLQGLVNFEKMRMLAKEVRSILEMSNLPFDTSQMPNLASMNQLEAVTTTKGKNKGGVGVNAKRMYEEMNMIRRIKTYLGRLEVVGDEELLYEMSYGCEGGRPPPPAPAPAPQAKKAPGSPTPSTASSASAATSMAAGSGVGIKNYGSAENYQKLMSLSEKCTIKEPPPARQRQAPHHSRTNSDSSSTTSSGHQHLQQHQHQTVGPSASMLLSQESSSVLPGVNRTTTTTSK